MDLKNSSQHRHHQNSNGRTESVHLATPPLAPLKKKKKKSENSQPSCIAAFREIPEMGRTMHKQPRLSTSNCLQPLPTQGAKQFALLLTKHFLQDSWKERWKGVEGIPLSDAS